jgi:hypothetical protein
MPWCKFFYQLPPLGKDLTGAELLPELLELLPEEEFEEVPELLLLLDPELLLLNVLAGLPLSLPLLLGLYPPRGALLLLL